MDSVGLLLLSELPMSDFLSLDARILSAEMRNPKPTAILPHAKSLGSR